MIIVVDNAGREARYPSAMRMEVDPSGALLLRTENKLMVAIWGPGTFQYVETNQARDDKR